MPKAAAAAGAAVTMGVPAGILTPAAFKAQQAVNRKRTTIIAVSTLAAMLVCAVGIKASGILSAGKGPASAGYLAVQGHDAQSMLKAAGADSPSMLGKGAALISMPDDVRDWLNHLKEVEARKRALTGDEMREAQLMSGQGSATDGLMTGDAVKDMTDPDSTTTAPPVVNDFQAMTAKFKQKWYDLSEFLRSKPAPAECQPIEESYDRGLNQMGMTMSDLGNMLNGVMDKAESDPEAAKQEGLGTANGIKNGHTKNIDQSFGVADQGVADICAKYHVSKMFDIDTHGSDGSSMTARG